jgi:hypothetical protein
MGTIKKFFRFIIPRRWIGPFDVGILLGDSCWYGTCWIWFGKCFFMNFPLDALYSDTVTDYFLAE